MNNIHNVEPSIYKMRVRNHAKKYRNNLTINAEKIKLHFNNINIPKEQKILGSYRHFNTFCNYDSIIEQVVDKWEDRDPVMCRDIIHSVSNKINDLILSVLIESNENKNSRVKNAEQPRTRLRIKNNKK